MSEQMTQEEAEATLLAQGYAIVVTPSGARGAVPLLRPDETATEIAMRICVGSDQSGRFEVRHPSGTTTTHECAYAPLP